LAPSRSWGSNNPTPQTEDLYIKSINTTVDQYRAFLEQVRTDTLVLPNRDLDSGQATVAAEYSLADDAYAQLLAQLSERKFNQTSPDLRDNLLMFYSDLSLPIETKKDQVRWQGVLIVLDQLKSVTPRANRRGKPGTVNGRGTVPAERNTCPAISTSITLVYNHRSPVRKKRWLDCACDSRFCYELRF
jgi:hypothetical protein